MKTIQEETQVEILDENKEVELLATINANWDLFATKAELAKFIEEGFIFGTFAENEHFPIDRIMALINEVELERNPIAVPEEQTIEIINE